MKFNWLLVQGSVPTRDASGFIASPAIFTEREQRDKLSPSESSKKVNEVPSLITLFS